MEMSNDKTITETLPVIYGKWTIDTCKDGSSVLDLIAYPTEQGIDHDYDMDQGGYRYCGNCLWADSIEEAKELIDEKQN